MQVSHNLAVAVIGIVYLNWLLLPTHCIGKTRLAVSDPITDGAIPMHTDIICPCCNVSVPPGILTLGVTVYVNGEGWDGIVTVTDELLEFTNGTHIGPLAAPSQIAPNRTLSVVLFVPQTIICGEAGQLNSGLPMSVRTALPDGGVVVIVTRSDEGAV